MVRVDEEEIDDMILCVSAWDSVNDLGVQSTLITDGDDIEVRDALVDERAGWRLARDDVQVPSDDFLLHRFGVWSSTNHQLGNIYGMILDLFPYAQ